MAGWVFLLPLRGRIWQGNSASSDPLFWSPNWSHWCRNRYSCTNGITFQVLSAPKKSQNKNPIWIIRTEIKNSLISLKNLICSWKVARPLQEFHLSVGVNWSVHSRPSGIPFWTESYLSAKKLQDPQRTAKRIRFARSVGVIVQLDPMQVGASVTLPGKDPHRGFHGSFGHGIVPTWSCRNFGFFLPV